jgi:hypothetical protein
MLARCLCMTCSRAVMGGYLGGCPHDSMGVMVASPFTWQKYAMDWRRGTCILTPSAPLGNHHGSTTTRCNVDTHLSVRGDVVRLNKRDPL